MASKAELHQRGLQSSDDGGPPGYSVTNAPLAYQSHSGFRTEFACIFIYGTDKLRLLNFSQADVERIKSIINTAWSRGIQEAKPYGMAEGIKLHGYPFKTSASGQGLLEGRQMLCRLLEELYNIGWILTETVDVCRTGLDKGWSFLKVFSISSYINRKAQTISYSGAKIPLQLLVPGPAFPSEVTIAYISWVASLPYTWTSSKI